MLDFTTNKKNVENESLHIQDTGGVIFYVVCLIVWLLHGNSFNFTVVEELFIHCLSYSFRQLENSNVKHREYDNTT